MLLGTSYRCSWVDQLCMTSVLARTLHMNRILFDLRQRNKSEIIVGKRTEPDCCSAGCVF